MMLNPLQFDEASHTYTLHGKKMTSVTTVLQEMDELPKYEDFTDSTANLGRGPDFYKLRGRAVATMMEADLLGTLIPDSLGKYVRPFYRGLKDFRATFNPILLKAEEPLYHPGLWYAGKTDLIAIVTFSNEQWIAVIDGKCSDSAREPAKATKLQTAAYLVAAQDMVRNKTLDLGEQAKHLLDKPWKRFGLMLYPEEKQRPINYRFVEYPDDYDILGWKGLVYHYHWRKRNK